MTDQNEGPEISGQQSLSFTENQTTERVLATYTATGPRGPVCPHNALEPDRYRGGRLHHRRERPADLPERPGPRASRRLQARQRLQPLRPGLRRAELRLPGGDGYRRGRERGPHHNHHLQDGLQLPGERHGHHLHLPGHGSRAGKLHLVALRSRRRRLHHQRDGRALLRQLSELREPHRLGQGQRLRGDGGGQGTTPPTPARWT